MIKVINGYAFFSEDNSMSCKYTDGTKFDYRPWSDGWPQLDTSPCAKTSGWTERERVIVFALVCAKNQPSAFKMNSLYFNLIHCKICKVV